MFELPFCIRGYVALGVLTLVMAHGPIYAQQAAPPPQPAPSSQQADKPADPPATNLIEGIGKLLSPSRLLPSPAKPDNEPAPSVAEPAPAVAPPPSAQQAPAATPPVAAAPPSSRFFPGMAGGREVCLPSANGAPDCQAAADKLCQAKGYKSGKSLNTDSAYACSARQARTPGGKSCGTEYYVTSAFCQ